MADDEGRNGPGAENPKEGVRIIGADEAEKALERDDVARRRSEGEKRFGDRPEPPPAGGPAPALRFPLSSDADPSSLGRPPLRGGNDGLPGDDDGGFAPAPPAGGEDDAELPHWTDPPTGKVPKILAPEDAAPDDDLDDWASFAGSSPRWRDSASDWDDDEADVAYLGADDTRIGALDDSDRPSDSDFFSFRDLDEPAGGRSVFADDDAYAFTEDDGYVEEVEPPLGVGPEDPYDEGPRRVVIGSGRRPVDETLVPDSGGRNVPQAVLVGVGIAALALVLFAIGPGAALVLVLAIVVLAAIEYFNAVRRAGHDPATLLGIVATAAVVLAAYHRGVEAIPAVLFLTTVVALLWYLVGAGSGNATTNAGLTLLGVLWVGTFGSFAALMLAAPNGIGLLLGAVLATVGYDVGGFFVGKNAGRAPLSAASPNKTVEGLIGGCVIAFVVAVAVAGRITPWGDFADAAMLGLVVAVVAPLGDLCESLVKRDLGIKDMGSVLPGHGGFLDRFDALLFVLPAVYYLARVNDFFL